MKKIKVLNAYSGIGGNRKNWDKFNLEITAVENNEQIAECYSYNFPKDNMIITDAHEYIRKNHQKYDIVWASPPCTTHTRIVPSNHERVGGSPYPDLTLYQEIIYLQNFHKNGFFIVENTIPYYNYLIPPNIVLERHPFWLNFYVPPKNFESMYLISGTNVKKWKNV